MSLFADSYARRALVMALLVGAQNMMGTFFGRGAEIAALTDGALNQLRVATLGTAGLQGIAG